ncbi:MAG TPA: hotdog domain-containing protein, partial [Bacteroidia bacterium]|nr:hotdog domain-containing protein [Bacteroidia bacterium]
GVTAAIIDDIIGATMISLDEQYSNITINNVIDYFSPAKENDIILAETNIIKNGSQVSNGECIVWNHDKTRMIARGYSNMLKKEAK